MNTVNAYKIINYFLALVWFVNGFFCKVLNMVPRHQAIVETILQTPHATLLTKIIGLSEIAMATWILTGISRRINVWTQVIIIAVMNLLEFLLVPHLLLWGKMNLLFACLLIALILYNEYHLRKTPGKSI